MLKMIDLCSGLGGASQAMKDRGWEVITIDNDYRFKPDLCIDVRKFHGFNFNFKVDLIWASPPCTEFAREWMPWTKTGLTPDMSIVKACLKIIENMKPRYWIIENVQGAVKYFEPLIGKPRKVINPYFLWGHFPPLGDIKITKRKKESYSSTQRADRARIPGEISLAVALAIENNWTLFEYPKMIFDLNNITQ